MQKKTVGIFLIILLIIPVLPASKTKEPQPDLICIGELFWYKVKLNSTIYNSFKVENVGDPGSLLDWEIKYWPYWGSWTFNPSSGTDLTPEDGPVKVNIVVQVPPIDDFNFFDEIRVINVENPIDNCTMQIGLVYPRPPVSIEKPKRAIYLNNQKIIDFIVPIILGPIDIDVSTNILTDWVEFYIDGKLKYNDTEEPFNWTWDEPKSLRYIIKIKAHDHTRQYTVRRKNVWTFF